MNAMRITGRWWRRAWKERDVELFRYGEGGDEDEAEDGSQGEIRTLGGHSLSRSK